MKIEWNKVTWYSWFLTSAVFIVIVPLIALYFVTEFEKIDSDKSSGIYAENGVGIEKQTICEHTSKIDDAGNTYDSVECLFSKIRKGDSFMADIGHGAHAVFTYTGQSLPSDSAEDFDSFEENNWTYQIKGENDETYSLPKSITIRIATYNSSAKVVGFTLSDLSFDGYFDILSAEQCGVRANCWKDIIWFDPNAQKYITADTSDDPNSLSSIQSESTLDLDRRTLDFGGTSGYSGSYLKDYAFIDNKWTLIGAQYGNPSDDEKSCVVRNIKLIEGEYVETSVSTPREADELC